jgi:dTDP-4-amino-4,6-dideoxygalactose transaminase
MDKPIFVTQPFLPPLNEFIEYIEKIWESKLLTNNGPLHQELEKALCEYLGVQYISLFSNGTLALITALHALNISGEVITTPFSFVASTHCLHWNGIKPVFCDIENDYFTIDPEKIEALITPETSAILAVHVYGNPCNNEKIQKIANTHNLKLIYDAAHAFGIKKDGISISDWGDLSVLSFHATKVYNTFEGGAIISHDEQTKKRIDLLKNFGFADEITVVAEGINAKMNEIQAAMGLLQLKYVDGLIEKRKNLTNTYRELLSDIEGIRFLNDIETVEHNYSYLPILIDKEKIGKTRDEVYEHLKKNNIFSRRYFYPLISQFSPYNSLESALPGKMPVAERIAEQVLCLPIYPDLGNNDVKKICSIIKKCFR